MERALVEVRWAGTRFISDGKQARKTNDKTMAHTVFVLGRKPGSITEINNAISSAHCPNCGAPASGGDTGTCDFCGALLNDGTRGWILLATVSPADAGAMLRGPAAPPPVPGNGDASIPSSAGLLRWMVCLAIADGEISPDEMTMLRAGAQRNGVPEEKLDEMIAAARQNQLHAPEPANQQEGEQWIRVLAREALADGKITSEEFQLLRATGTKIGLVDYDINQIVKETRAQMLAEAKSALRNRG